MNITTSNVIGELVAADYRSAEVFARYGIDFCCKGGQSIQAVCAKKNLDPSVIIAELNAAVSNRKDAAEADYANWRLDRLATHIEEKHHRYVEEKIPVIRKYLMRVCEVHGAAHPELIDVLELFNETASALAVHMKKEELVLFPYVKKLATGDLNRHAPFGSVANPIEMMREDHNVEGERFRRIAELTEGYTPPATACNTYRVTFSLLKEFEQDLHKHIHLENNILFPQALELEAKLNGFSCPI